MTPDAGAAVPPEECAALVRAAVAGDERAMERLLLRARQVAWRFSLAVCGQADDAQDALQEALLKTFRHARQIRDPEAFRPWLYRTVRNACLVGRRKKVAEPRQLESLDAGRPAEEPRDDLRDPARDPEELAAAAERSELVRRALLTLPPGQRAVVFLREMEGLSTREAAAVLEISEDAVKTRLRRARAALQQALGESAAVRPAASAGTRG